MFSILIGHTIRDVKDTDHRLQCGIDDTRRRLLGHLVEDQNIKVSANVQHVQVNRPVVIATSQTVKHSQAVDKVVINNFHTPVFHQTQTNLKYAGLSKSSANSIPT